MSDSDSDKTSTTMSLCIDEFDNRLVYSDIESNRTKVQSRGQQWHDFEASDSENDELKFDEKLLGEGSEEDDALLVIYQDSGSANWQ